MNEKGQFSIIAALLVAVILISTVVITYSTIRNSPIQNQPQVQSAIDETNLALKQILGFTIGYYGSILQVTGNSSYAKTLALNYLQSGLENMGNMHPEWGTSFNVTRSQLYAYWFTNTSYSTGELVITYNLTGLGIYGVSYETSSRLDVKVMNTTADNEACLEITKDGIEPLINLGKQNFKFYRYWETNSSWTLIEPSTEPIAYANGTYLVDIPSGIDPKSYVIQVKDSRGIIVVASTFSHYTITLSWSSAQSSSQNYVDNNTSDVDASEDKGSHSNFPAQQSFDGVFDTLTEGKTSRNFLAKKGTFTKATTTGTQAVTGVGFTPKVVILWWTRQTLLGELPSISVGYGFATNYSGLYQNRGVAFASDDGLADSNAGRYRSETYSIIILSSGNPTATALASITSFDADGFSLNWQINENRADIIHYLALGGEDLIYAKAGSFSLSTASGTQDITGVGFQPNFAMFLWTYTEAVNTGTSHAEIGIGFAASPTKRAALVAASEDGRGTTDTWRQQRTDSCILLLDPTSGSQDAIVDFSQFLADGFRVNKIDAPAAITPIFYLALKGGNYDVGSFNSPTSTGTQDIATLGFQPAAIMLATQGRSSTMIGQHAEASLGGATSAADRGVTWFEDRDGLSTSDNEMETLNTRIIQWRDRTASDTFSLRGSADFVSFLSTGFRLSWSNVEASGRQVIYVAFGGDNYELDLEVQWTNVYYNGTTEELAIYVDNMNATENLRVDVWYGGSWQNLFPSLVNGWNNVSVIPYLDASVFTIRFKGASESLDSIQDSWRIDATILKVWPSPDLYASLQNATVVIELLQNGTMRWLGQNLQLSTQAQPIPPIPVKAIRVNQTIDGVNTEVPFQIEDWASEYRIPLGLANNASVFNNRNMLVFLVTSKVSKITIWWDGGDDVNQTAYAYTNRYFTGDNPSGRTLTNGILTLQFPPDDNDNGFPVTSTAGTQSSVASFMRINNEWSVYGASPAYVIHHGIVRDIVHQESEWSGGADNCPNLYAHVVITLPANASYYTYQLRLMFVNSQQARTITDLCPLKLTTMIGTPQTENGIVGGFPAVSEATGLFYNTSSSTWEHHWSQFISGNRGTGIMFTDTANEMLYVFDAIAGDKTGALRVSNATERAIELAPVTSMAQVAFTYALDVTWHGAVVTFDGTTPIYSGENGLWIIVEYPPTVTVTTEG
ncbi:MAG: hypothetical protein QHH18_03755 [Candidatus Bathyarchaeota archaeon]|nr:hypothetical protein [Candidatus Bathyarchaeota archaeon A05DMB-5]MDH7557707.1 hypothetical protein [Candidatus Bathyarchaeota archaeon]